MADEIIACSGWFYRQLLAVKPMVVVCLGRVAADVVLASGEVDSLNSLRGKWHHTNHGTPLLAPTRVTYHPAYIARNPGAENKVLEDLKAVREEIDQRLSRVGQSEDEGQAR
jgi:DNA polymerase